MHFELTGEAAVFEELQAMLAKKGKTAIRLKMAGVGWNGPLYDLELSDLEQEEDVYEDIQGVRFVVTKKHARGIGKKELIKHGRIMIKKDACCEGMD